MVPDTVHVFAEGEIIGRKLKSYLQNHAELDTRLGKEGQRLFYSTGEVASFEKLGAGFLGEPFSATRVTLG
jgi:glutamate racemase